MGSDTIGKFNGKDAIIFMPEQAEELLAEFRKNQPVRVKATKQGDAIGKVLEQSNLLHACFKLVLDTAHESYNFKTFDQVKMKCKVDIDFRDPRYCFVRPDGGVQFTYRSYKITGPDALKGQERVDIVQKSLQWCADTLGLSVDQLVLEAQSKMQRN